MHKHETRLYMKKVNEWEWKELKTDKNNIRTITVDIILAKNSTFVRNCSKTYLFSMDVRNKIRIRKRLLKL